MKLIFATNNQHKAEEVKAVVNQSIEIITLKEAGINIDIPEPHDTLEANATEKSRTIYRLVKTDPGILGCFSEDTGLEVTALNGEPGVRSARYAGEGRSFDKNIEKLLQKLGDKGDKTARFRAVISLIINERETQFEGVCEGKIIDEKRGIQGFGYDPVFVPAGSHKTFGEMDLEEKKTFSHRTKATEKLVAFLNTIEP
ncbi:MAG: RdgB/HAM1 family non-canonical purine NTP pyrophosphatase [Bacteroidetes bacterium]|jgi:XTP/dITP diphosphohydrolase|nr:MAG: RdgB/HAM1 family non-canonical purine NTP pyrophosphatase [Bacteroidota bacterium]